MDMAQRLEQIMGDEGAMAQIRQLAQSMGMGGGGGQSHSPTPLPEQAPSTPDLGGIMNMLASTGMLGGGGGSSSGGESGGDDNVRLLRSLKPFLSKKRRRRVNEAVRIMQLLDMLPLLQQSGMLNGLMGGQEDDD